MIEGSVVTLKNNTLIYCLLQRLSTYYKALLCKNGFGTQYEGHVCFLRFWFLLLEPSSGQSIDVGNQLKHVLSPHAIDTSLPTAP